MSSGGLDLDTAARALRDGLGAGAFDAVVVTGSGLGAVGRAVEEEASVPFDAVPGLPGASVAGHGGRWIAGRLGGARVLVQSGRYHAYEGYGPGIVTAPVRLAALAGASVYVSTSAVGGIAPSLGPGDLVVLDGHVDARWAVRRAGSAVAPVREPEPYDAALREAALDVARGEGVGLTTGTYAVLLGPSYETRAEVEMLRRLGADVVGMSTVPEVLAARACGLRCLAFSVVANRAVGAGSVGPLDHADVLAVVERAAGALTRLVAGVLGGLVGRAQPAGTK